MPSKSSVNGAAASRDPLSKQELPVGIEAKLDAMLLCLQRIDKRDKIRMTGSIIRSIIGLVPLAVFLVSIWYAIYHGDELLKQITKQAATAAAEATKSSGQGIFEDLMKQYGTPKK